MKRGMFDRGGIVACCIVCLMRAVSHHAGIRSLCMLNCEIRIVMSDSQVSEIGYDRTAEETGKAGQSNRFRAYSSRLCRIKVCSTAASVELSDGSMCNC
jgi:hypothetical protein